MSESHQNTQDPRYHNKKIAKSLPLAVMVPYCTISEAVSSKENKEKENGKFFV